MKKTQRTLRLRTETVRILASTDLPRVAGGGIYTEPATTSSDSKAYTHCDWMSDCVAPVRK